MCRRESSLIVSLFSSKSLGLTLVVPEGFVGVGCSVVLVIFLFSLSISFLF